MDASLNPGAEGSVAEGLLRAEGGSEADWVQVAEALIWFAVLGVGLVAARRYLIRLDWRLPLGIGLAAVVVLLVLTYLQPALWIRFAALIALSFALGKEARYARAENAVPGFEPLKATLRA